MPWHNVILSLSKLREEFEASLSYIEIAFTSFYKPNFSSCSSHNNNNNFNNNKITQMFNIREGISGIWQVKKHNLFNVVKL